MNCKERMEREPNGVHILTIGFDGLNRAGKGTYIDNLTGFFSRIDMPYVILRGDGSRPASGEHIGDPPSLWWKENWDVLHQGSNMVRWQESSTRLARELRVSKKRIFPNYLRQIGKNKGVIILDRSIVSRASMYIEEYQHGNPDDFELSKMYDINRLYVLDTLLPDLLFVLVANKETLLQRLSSQDPKFEFRYRLINDSYDYYTQALQLIKLKFGDRVVVIDTTQAKELVSTTVQNELKRKFSSFLKV